MHRRSYWLNVAAARSFSPSTVPRSLASAVLSEATCRDEVFEALLDGVAVGAGESDDLSIGETAMGFGEVEDLQGQFGERVEQDTFPLDLMFEPAFLLL